MTFKTEQEAIDDFMLNVRASGFVDFDGQNCAEAWDEGADCQGWDGEDRRCDCGNRRVALQTMKLENGNWFAYAEAY